MSLMGQLSYVGALKKSKPCQLSKLKYSAHADFLVRNFKTIIIKFIDCAVTVFAEIFVVVLISDVTFITKF